MNWQIDADEFAAAPELAGHDADEHADELEDIPPAPDYEAIEDDPEPSTATWHRGLGFPDGSQAVRVWGNEDGELVRVRVSLNWRERLQNSSLEESFFVCFALLNGASGLPPLVPAPEPLPDLAVKQQLSWSFLDDLARQQAELETELAALNDTDTDRWEGDQVCESDFDKRACVRLDLHGRPVTVNFSPSWVAEAATAGEISRAVMSAYRNARAKYTPPRPHYSARTLQARRLAQLNRTLLTAMRNGLAT